MYDRLPYDREELARAMRETYDELIDFVTTPEFTALMTEFGSLQPQERPQFVLSVLLDTDELRRRGIDPPEGVLIQRSAFGDRRPTLFVVKKFLPERYSDVWQNVNITIDNEFADEAVSRNPDVAWRPPLPIPVQAQLMSEGRDLETI